MSVLETPAPSLPTLEQKLQTTARLRMLSWVCVGLALAVTATIAAFATYSLIDLGWHLSSFGRLVAVAATGLLGIGMIALGLHLAWRQSRDRQREVLAVQQANPELGNALSASLLYGADATLTRRESSPAIVDRLVSATAQTAERATFTRAVSWRTPKMYALIALALLLAALIAAQMNLRIFSLTWQRFLNPWAELPAPTWTALGAIGPHGTPENRWQVPAGAAVTVTAEVLEHDPGEAFIETRTANSDWLRRKMYKLNATGDGAGRYGYDIDNLLQDVQYRVICGDAESVRLNIPVSIDPQLADLEIVITGPAFLRRQPTVVRGVGDIDALTGSTVEIRARANKPLAAGQLEFFGPAAAGGESTASVSAATTVAGQIGVTPYADACEAALALAKLNPEAATAVPIGPTDHDLIARFTVGESGQYRLILRDRDDKRNGDELRYSIRARSNNPPKVKITAPGKDLSVKTNATVGIDLTAEDDFSLREVGLYLMIDRTIQRKTLLRPADGKTAVRADYDLELGHHTFQGGEVITYWAFAVDEDGSVEGREITSEPQFLMTFAENNFEQDNQQQPPPMSDQNKKATLGLDQLIEDQKGTVKDTFALHMQMGLSFNRKAFAKAAGADGAAQPAAETAVAELPPPTAVKPEHAARSTTLGATQTRIQNDLRQLIADVKAELAKLQAEAPSPATPGTPGGPGGEPAPPQNGLGAKELELLEQAAAKMDEVQPPLKANRPDSAVKPENEALRLMSEARKLILSNNGSGQMKMALDSAQRKKQQRDRQQQDQQAQQTAEQMRKLPPMLEDMEEMQEEAKKLEKRLEEQQKQAQANQPPPNAAQPQTEQQKKEAENRRLDKKHKEEENRRLAEALRDRSQELANLAKETADRLREMNQNSDANKDAQRQRDQAAEKMEQTARKLTRAADQAGQAQKPEDAQQAQKDLADAQADVKDAADKLNQSLQSQNRQRLDQAVQDAQQLEQRQQQLAQETAGLQKHAANQPQPANSPKTPPPAGTEPQTPAAGDPATAQQQTAARNNLAQQQKSLETDLGALRERLKDLADQLDRDQPAGTPQSQVVDALNEAARKAETRGDLQRDLNNAAKELQSGDLNRATDKQQSAAQGMRDLRQDIEQAQAHNAGAARDELNRTLDQLADLRRKINQAKQTQEENPAAQPDTAPLATQAEQTAKQVEDLAAADRQTRRDAADKLQRAIQQLQTPAGAERPQQLQAAAQDVAAAAKDLERALQSLDQNQVQKTQKLVDRALANQQAANLAMTDARDAKTQQAQRQANPEPTATPANRQATERAAQQADAAAKKAADRQRQAADTTTEIEEALRKLQTYLNGGRNPDQQPPAASEESQPRKLAQAAADRFADQKIPGATQTLADKIAELRDKQTAPTASAEPSPTAPTRPQPGAPIDPRDAAAKWQEHHAAGGKIENDLTDIHQRLAQLQAAIDQDELKRLEAAKQAVQAMEQKLAPTAGEPQPGTTPPKPIAVDATPPSLTDPKTAGASQPLTADALKQMNRDLDQLKGDLGRLNLDEKTMAAIELAGENLRQALQESPTGRPQADPQAPPNRADPRGRPQPGDQNQPGEQPQPHGRPQPQSGEQPTFADRPGTRAGRDQLRFVRGGLERAIERVLEDRRIGSETADEAPRRYDALVDKYFETLSDEQIEKNAIRNQGR